MIRIFKTANKLNDLLENTVKQGDCLEWIRALNTDGYPRMAGNVKVHRLVYELFHQENIDGFVIRHTCDNPKCINPKHLLKGTPKENGNDKFIRDRQPRVITKEVVFRVNDLLKTNKLTNKEIALILGIDQRRVSDIKCGRYCNATGKFLGHG